MRNPDFRVLIGSEGGFNVDGASGKLINKELKSIVGQMTGSRMPRVSVGLNFTETKRVLQQQIQAIANGLDITTPVKTKLYATESANARKLRLSNIESQSLKLDDYAWDSLVKANTLDTKIATAQQRIQNLKKNYSAFVGDTTLVKEWNQLFDQSRIVGSEKELTNLNAKVGEFEQKLIAAGKHGASAFSEMANNFGKMAAWMAMGTMVAGITRGITGIYDAVVDVDTAMTELRKVTSATTAEYDKFLVTAADRAVDLGAGLPDLIQATSNFARLGEYTLETAEQLGEVATVYHNVGDEIASIDDATESIVSTMKAFDVVESDAMSIADKFNEVGNNFAISSGGIGEAMQRSAASLALANNTIDESIGLIVAANNVVQDPDVVGTAWKSISMRIRGAKSELEDAGLETDGMVESASKLRELVSGLTGGVDIMLDEDTFKSTYQIIKEISEVWDQMTDIDQASLLELLAGKRQGNVLASTITGFKDAEKAMRTAMNSTGSAMEEHAKWLDSIEAKQQRFSAQYSAFAQSVLDSDLIKGTFDAGTGLLGWMTSLVETTGALPPLLATLSGLHSLASGDGIFRVDTDKDWGGSGIGISTAFGMSKKAAEEFAAQIETDHQCLLKWEKAVAAGNISVENFNTIMEGASSQARTYATQTKGATGAANEFRAAQIGVAASAQKASIATKAAAVGVQVLNLAMNMLLGFGVAMALQGLASGVDHIANAAVNASEKADEAAASRRAVATAAAEEVAELNELIAKYRELRKYDHVDAESRTEIANIQSQITDLVGAQASNLDLVNGKLDEELKKLQQISLESATVAQDAAVGSYHAARESANKAVGNKNFLWVEGYDYVGEWDEEAFNLLKDLKSAEGLPVATKGSLFGSTLFVNTYGDAEERIEQLRKAMEALKQANDYDYSNSDLYSGLTAQLNHYENYVSQANAAALNLADTTAAKVVMENQLSGVVVNSVDAYQKYRAELIATVTAEKALSTAMADGSVTTDMITEAVDNLLSINLPEWYNATKMEVVSANKEMAESAVEFVESSERMGRLRDTLSSLADLETQFESLSEALGEFRDEGIVSSGTLAGLQSVFGELSGFEEFVNAAGNSKSTFSQVQSACNSLAEEYINTKANLGDLTEETKAMTIAELESIGVKNAAAVVSAELAAQRANAKIAALDHANATYADVAAIYDEAIKAETDTVAIQRLRLEKLKGRAASIDFATANASVIASLVSEANAAGIAASKISALIELERLKARVDAGLGTGGLLGSEYREKIEDLARQAKAQVNSVKADLITLSDVTIKPPKISSSSSGSSSSNSNKSTKTQEQLRKEEFEALYNEKKHQLAMEQISTQEFYDWLVDAKKGYMAYFKENSEEFRKYEEEAFALRKELADDYISSIDDEIEILERQDDSESLIIAKYREKQQVIKELMEAHVAYLKSIGASEDAIANNDYLKDLLKSWWEIQDSIDDITESLNNDLADGMQSILDMTIEIVKKEGEKAKEALEEQKDEYNDIIEKKRELLKMSEQERQYQDEVSEKNKELEKIEARIAALRADDSREAAAERGALEEQRAELQKELANMQNDHYLDSADAALEKELDDWNAQQDAKIEAIEDLLDDEVRLTEIAMERLDDMNEELFQDLLTYATTYCDMSRHEFEEMWDAALAAAEKYGSYTNAMEAVPGNGKETEASEIIKQMEHNRAAYAAATTDAEREYYSKQNEKLGQQLSEVTGEKVYRDAGGHWWIGDEYLFDYGKGTGNSDSSVSKKNAEKVSEIVGDMKEYSKKWGSSGSDKQKIHETVALMAKDLEKYGVFVEFNSGSGKWIITQDNNDPTKKGKWLYEVYHRGGVAGGYADLRQREILAKLEVGEMILTKEHQANLSRLLDSFTPVQNIGAMLASMAGKLNSSGSGNSVTVQVNAPLSVSNDISNAKFKKMAQENARYIANEVAKVVGA